jgi:Xaa-Pro aminopeptidase
MEIPVRIDTLRKTLTEHHLDALLVSQPENRRYLSGFTGSAGWLFITTHRCLLATDSRYHEQSAREAPAFELVKVRTTFPDVLPAVLADLGVRRLGFESQHVTVDDLRIWTEATKGVEWLPLRNTVEALRAFKDADEIAAIRRSVALTDAALARLVEVLRPGMTEREAAWEIESYMRLHGASKVAFDLIVAAGPNGAQPHARATDHPIQAGEPIVVDIGCVVDGYCSDLTRTICLGAPTTRYLEVWAIVLKAQQVAEEGIRAGVSGVAADALARDVIVGAGYGEYFGHGLGHSLGLAVHENPRASRQSTDLLQSGMTLTVEPGIYLPGEFGVRIEDLVVIGEDGIEILSRAPKTPVVGN